MPRKGENIYKRKDGRWEGRYRKGRDKGKTRYGTVYARSYREVKEKLNQAKMLWEQGEKTCCGYAGSVSEVSGRWLESAAANLKESSMVKYENVLRTYILPVFGDQELSEITNEQLADFCQNLFAEGGVNGQGLSSSTILSILSVFNSLRIYAMRGNCRISFSTECVPVKREQKGVRVFSMEEERRMLVYLTEHMNLTNLGILLCFFTGLRIGEVCALSWDDFYLEEKTLCIRKTMQRLKALESREGKTQVKIFEPKSSHSIRLIPLPERILEYLLQYYKRGTFFLTCQAEKFIEPRTMQNRFKTVLRLCGVEDANFHAIRHTFATRCVEVGFDVKSLSEILGHASVTITMNRYVHPSMKLKSENMDRLSQLFAVK